MAFPTQWAQIWHPVPEIVAVTHATYLFWLRPTTPFVWSIPWAAQFATDATTWLTAAMQVWLFDVVSAGNHPRSYVWDNGIWHFGDVDGVANAIVSPLLPAHKTVVVRRVTGNPTVDRHARINLSSIPSVYVKDNNLTDAGWTFYSDAVRPMLNGFTSMGTHWVPGVASYSQRAFFDLIDLRVQTKLGTLRRRLKLPHGGIPLAPKLPPV